MTEDKVLEKLRRAFDAEDAVEKNLAIRAAFHRIEQLTAEVRECHENINLKADFIDAKINQLAEADEKIEQLTAEVERLNEALRECVMEAADWARQAGEAKGKLEGSEMPGIVDGWKAENERLREALNRIATVDMGGGFLGALACRQVARAALEGKQ